MIGRLLNEESNHTPQLEALPDQALYVAPKGKTPRHIITCFGCGKKGHYKSECTEPVTLPVASAGLAILDENYEF